MALSERQKAIRRMLIQNNPQLDYMDNILGDENFAIAEIAAKVSIILANKQSAVEQFNAQKQFVENQLAKLYSDIEILTNGE